MSERKQLFFQDYFPKENGPHMPDPWLCYRSSREIQVQVTVQSTLFSVLCTVQSVLYSVHCIEYTVLYTEYSVLYTVHRTLYCTLYRVHCSMQCTDCTVLYTVQSTEYSFHVCSVGVTPQCIQCSVAALTEQSTATVLL